MIMQSSTVKFHNVLKLSCGLLNIYGKDHLRLKGTTVEPSCEAILLHQKSGLSRGVASC